MTNNRELLLNQLPDVLQTLDELSDVLQTMRKSVDHPQHVEDGIAKCHSLLHALEKTLLEKTLHPELQQLITEFKEQLYDLKETLSEEKEILHPEIRQLITEFQEQLPPVIIANRKQCTTDGELEDFFEWFNGEFRLYFDDWYADRQNTLDPQITDTIELSEYGSLEEALFSISLDHLWVWLDTETKK